MDPLSITASVLGISAACASVITTLKDVYDKYKLADLTILAICSETGAVQAALSQIESLLSRDGDGVIARFQQQPVLAQAFDTSITGCTMLYSCLETELAELAEALKQDGSLDWKRKFKAAWRQDTMVGLQQQIRGQELALTTLLQGLQMESLIEVHRLLQDHSTQLIQINHNTSRLRSAYPASTVPDSVFDNKRSAGSIFGAADSVLGAEDFAFDDTIVNSKAYRRAMALAQAQFEGLQVKDKQDGPPQDDNASVSSSTASESTSRNVGLSDPGPSELGGYRPRRSVPKKYPDLDVSSPVEWAKAFNLSSEDIIGHDKKEVEFQNVLWELLTTEAEFLKQLEVIRRLFADQIVIRWPEVVPNASNFAKEVFGEFQVLHDHHKDLLFVPMLEWWQHHGPWTTFDVAPFVKFADGARDAYVAFAKSFPVRRGMIESALQQHLRFRLFVDELKQHPWCQRLSWDILFNVPMIRLKRYRLLFAVMGKTAMDPQTKGALSKVDEIWTALLRECDQNLVESEDQAKLTQLARRVGERVSFWLDFDRPWTQPAPRFVRQGTFPCQLRSLDSSPSAKWTKCDVFVLYDLVIVLDCAARVGAPFPDIFIGEAFRRSWWGYGVERWPPITTTRAKVSGSPMPRGTVIYGVEISHEKTRNSNWSIIAAELGYKSIGELGPESICIGLATRDRQDEWFSLLENVGAFQNAPNCFPARAEEQSASQAVHTR